MFLYDVTGAAELVAALSGANGSTINGLARLSGRFTLAATSILELRHRCGSTQATTGFGAATSFGTEIYADVEIRRVA